MTDLPENASCIRISQYRLPFPVQSSLADLPGDHEWIRHLMLSSLHLLTSTLLSAVAWFNFAVMSRIHISSQSRGDRRRGGFKFNFTLACVLFVAFLLLEFQSSALFFLLSVLHIDWSAHRIFCVLYLVNLPCIGLLCKHHQLKALPVTSFQGGEGEDDRTAKRQMTEAATGTKQEATEAATGTKQEATEAATGTKQEATEAATGTKQETAEAATGTKQETAEAATGTKQETAEAATGTKQETPEAAKPAKQEMAEACGPAKVSDFMTVNLCRHGIVFTYFVMLNVCGSSLSISFGIPYTLEVLLYSFICTLATVGLAMDLDLNSAHAMIRSTKLFDKVVSFSVYLIFLMSIGFWEAWMDECVTSDSIWTFVKASGSFMLRLNFYILAVFFIAGISKGKNEKKA